jgi:hypothetical protein
MFTECVDEMVSDLTVITASSDARPFASDDIFYPLSTSLVLFSQAVDQKLVLTLASEEEVTYVGLYTTLPEGSSITVEYWNDVNGILVLQVSEG